jgi:hypothetical protein
MLGSAEPIKLANACSQDLSAAVVLTRIAPSLNKAYVVWSPSISTSNPTSYVSACHTTANSMLFPKLTATRMPFFTPCAWNPAATELLLWSSSSYVSRVCWAREITAFWSPCFETIDAKCSGIVWSSSGGYEARSQYMLRNNCTRAIEW